MSIRDDVLEWANEYSDDEVESLHNLIEHGCQSGIVSDLVYYSDTLAYYRKNRKEINALVKDSLEGTGMRIDEMFHDWDTDDPFAQDTNNRNILAWFGFEETAQNLLIEMGEIV